MAFPTNDIKFNVKNGLAVGASGFPVINTAGEWVGASGPGQSPYGATGAVGYDGPKGDDGVQGATGVTGQDGQQGATGHAGTDGASGVVGRDGATGINGQIGTAGATGPTGQDGAQGDQGVQGPDGQEGPQGQEGLQGATGGNGGIVGGAALDPSYLGSGLALSNNNLSVTDTGPGYYTVLGTNPIGSQKTVFSFQYEYDDGGDYLSFIGLAARSMNLNGNGLGVAYELHSVGLSQKGYYWWYGASSTTDWNLDTSNWVPGDIIDVAVDPTNNKWWVRVNGGYWNNNPSDPATGSGGYSLHALDIDADLYPAITVASENGPQQYVLQTSAIYSLPSGFSFYSGTGAHAANKGETGATGPTGETGATGPAGARYHTTSNTTLSLTTGATGVVVNDDYLQYSVGQIILITDGGGKHIHATVDSYDPVTKTLNFTPIDHVGTGSASSWEINLDGAEGIVGASGVTGQDGATGVIGSTGPQGFGGDRGATGADGEQGSDGPQGATGIAGASGAKGEQGVDGEQGFTGADGEQGPLGPTGQDGAQGIDGSQGEQGPDGATGVVGATGMQGGDGSTGGNGIYGNTTPQVTYSATANSLSLGFIANDSYENNNNLHFDDFNPATEVLNSGARYWEYIGLSTKQNFTAVTNATAIDTSWDNSHSRYYIAMVETLNGLTTPPANDDWWSFQDSYGSYVSSSAYVPNNGVVVISVGVEGAGSAITSITDTEGFTWIKRSAIIAPGSHADTQAFEVWYAINDTGSNKWSHFTINYAQGYDDLAGLASTWTGVDLANVWDGTGSGPTNRGIQGSTGATGIKGPDGNQGYDGASGPTGRDGASGIDGNQGVTGQTGETGVKGTDGATGPTGADGSQGISGVNAATGATGQRGIQGLRGATGVEGASGVTGDTGDYGATGWYGHRFKATIQSGGYVIGDTGSGDIYLQIDPDTYDYSYSFTAGQTIILYKDASNYATALVSSYDNNTGDLYVTIETTTGSSNPSDTLYVNIDSAVGIEGDQGVTGPDGATGPTGATGAQGGNGAGSSPFDITFTHGVDFSFVAWTDANQNQDSLHHFEYHSGDPIASIVDHLQIGDTITINWPACSQGAIGPIVLTVTGPADYTSMFTERAIKVDIGPAAEVGHNQVYTYNGTDTVEVAGIGAPTNTGASGATGATGATGIQGFDGDQGVIGNDGATGPKGDTGVDGATGVIGATGSEGDTGASGIHGATGFSLVTGSTGISGTSQTIVDMFASNEVGTAKYLVQGVNGSNVQATEVILTQNTTGVYITEYATLRTNTKVMDVTATTNGSVVSLKVTPTSSGTTVSWVRESVRGRIGGTTVEDDGSNIYYSFTHSDNGSIPVGKAYVYPNSYWSNQINFTSLIGTSVTFDSAGVGPQNPAIGEVVSWDGGTLVVTIVSGNFTSRTDLDKITYGY